MTANNKMISWNKSISVDKLNHPIYTYSEKIPIIRIKQDKTRKDYGHLKRCFSYMKNKSRPR